MEVFKKIALNKHSLEEISNTDNYSKKNSTKIVFNPNIFLNFLLQKKIHEYESFVITQVFVTEGFHFGPNEPILRIEGKTFQSGSFIVKLPYGGVVNSIITNEDFRANTEILDIEIIENETYLTNKIFNERQILSKGIIISKTIDDFTDEWIIKFNRVLFKKTKFLELYDVNCKHKTDFIGLSFTNNNGFPYIEFNSRLEKFNITKNDELILLFEDKERLNIIFQKSSTGQKGNKHNFHPLDESKLNLFLNKKLIKIKIINKKNSTYTICSFNHDIKYNHHPNNDLCPLFNPQYFYEGIGQITLIKMTFEFIKLNLNQS